MPGCPLCGRPIPKHARQSIHHLIPKLKGGAKGPRVLLHEICHRKIHAVFTETELARNYNTIEALRGHPQIAAFVKWLARKPGDFHAPTFTPGRKSSNTRR
ncbi:MAG: HNH endonuclease signature motif containing protein [Pseudomonadota bacterium]